ncbi:hypothetical protein PC113_g19310 [Phytophthora cactorum]|uniref:Uncharacterized protein n=1 Tax=Phytophthora cactorum TaxID=29920 RepID=A0A8T0YDM0_9STRA|nr:hypothetical protein PC113_g19310 [Phytophthora cactorum]
MQLLLYELEFHYVVGKKWHILADTAAVVSLRGTYIEYKLSNRRPTRRGKTWLLDDKTRYNKSGKGPRACIVAAGFISSKGGSTCKFQLEGNENQVDGACYAIKREANLHGSNHSIQV